MPRRMKLRDKELYDTFRGEFCTRSYKKLDCNTCFELKLVMFKTVEECHFLCS
jgi:hypothetical protein